jgi:hypothetical protein
LTAIRRSVNSVRLLARAALAGAAVCTQVWAQTPPPAPVTQSPAIQSPSTPAPSTPSAAPAQAAADAPKPHPGDLYKQAMQPLDVVRSSLDNWSDAELGALAEGIRQARQECGQASPDDYTEDDLYDLARLCALGQDWNTTLSIAQKYLASDGRAQRAHRARVYAMAVNALIQTRGLAQAVGVTREMLSRLPFDAVVAESASYLTTYLEHSLDPAAVELANEQHPLLIDALGKGVPLLEINGSDATNIGELYENAMQLAFLERYAGQDEAAAAAVADAKAALAKLTAVSAEDQRLIQAVDTRYGLLGEQVPTIEVAKFMVATTTRAKILHDDQLATVYALFPQWCPQCRRMMKPMAVLAHPPAGAKFLAYGLMMQGTRAPGELVPAEDTFKDLQGTLTMLVPQATASAFGATTFPLGVVADKAGKIRYIGTLTTNAFDERGFIEQVVKRSTGPKILLGVEPSVVQPPHVDSSQFKVERP